MAIVSFKHGFIFVKTKKTAGTSMELHLARYCGPDDIITPMTKVSDPQELLPDIVREHIHPNHTPRNFGNNENPDLFYHHMPAITIAQQLGTEIFLNMFSFCFERHPVEKCISYFAMWRYYRSNTPPDKQSLPILNQMPSRWEEYLERGPFPHDHPRYCTPDGTLIVNKIYQYEQLAEATKDIHERFELPTSELEDKALSGMRTGARYKGEKIPTIEEVRSNPAQYNMIMDRFSPSLRFVNYH